ncbi:hypothetical protein [Streptantibioticus cattleyicolor]|uniref:Uncharacterized protein n=1 Tax=Streptantibioticus cattleyicolor (strain ATCC 35852 / DSM 46488 / JCM 4925 / NBRC 14057 / NRRL 8057) TaxID=1003195 RepID=F8JMD6_STREN|nr:hypothetical protein [Streptantibioticus cattleyicolor]AEW99383.1 hypothetical protein SCATT_p11900 [Streptantibioticus cattleyicolor NRRL 8057 = DSM 46488]CCB71574.1 protein of unknown function [Streptantibioticus cattleyicolor NRRL 8057 = DSM 46488]
MALVSAIPENLYQYSKDCTAAIEQLQTWVRTTLTSAVLAYQNGGGLCNPLDSQVTAELARAHDTDKNVALVAQAFLRAGGVTVRAQGSPITVPDGAVDRAVEQLRNQARTDAGAKLAGQLEPNPGSDNLATIDRVLAQHVNDPYFTAGFFDNLTRFQIERMMSDATGVQALVTAYAGGQLSKNVTDDVAQGLGWVVIGPQFPVHVDHYHISPQQQTALLDALAANPIAARAFADSLSKGQLRDLFHGPAALNPAFRAHLFGVLTSAVGQEPDQAHARDLMDRVSAAFFGPGAPHMVRHDWPSLAGPAARFYAAGAARIVPAPPGPGASPVDIEKWLQSTGRQMGDAIAPFLHAVNSADLDHTLLRNMLQGAAINVWAGMEFFIAPEAGAAKITFDAAVGALESLMATKDEAFPGLIPPGTTQDPVPLNRQILAQGSLAHCSP